MSYPRTPTTTTSAATTTPNAIPNEPYDASPTTPTDSATPSASTPSKPHSSPTLLQSPLFSTQKDVKACVRSPGTRANQRHCEVRTFATTTNALLELRDWLVEQKVTLVAMEATGDYWRPPVRHEAPRNRVGMKGPCRWSVAAGR